MKEHVTKNGELELNWLGYSTGNFPKTRLKLPPNFHDLQPSQPHHPQNGVFKSKQSTRVQSD
jgi:hypothetical protein